jgi:hypothetical protein
MPIPTIGSPRLLLTLAKIAGLEDPGATKTPSIPSCIMSAAPAGVRASVSSMKASPPPYTHTMCASSDRILPCSFAGQRGRPRRTALHLRAMNTLFEGLKDKGALVMVPSSAVDTIDLGGLSGMVALAQSGSADGDQA